MCLNMIYNFIKISPENSCLVNDINLFFPHLQTTLTFELTYNAPDGSVGMWQRGGFEPIKNEELRGVLTEDERNALNIDRRASTTSGHSRALSEHANNSEDGGDKMSVHSSTGKSIGSSRLSIASKSSGIKSPKT